MMRLGDRRKEVLFALTLIVGVLLAAVAGEILMRALEWQKGLVKERSFEWAGLRAAAIFPSSEGEMERFIPGAEYRHIHINSLGFRGREIDVPKPPGTIRIAFLGDSMMLGADVPEEQTISGTAAAALERAYPSCRFDYVKVAGPLYTLRMLSDVLPVEVRPLEPDIYVLLAGTITEVLREHQARNPEALQFVVDSEPHFMTRHSRLLFHVIPALHRERERRRAERIDLRQELPDQEVATILKDQIEGLAKEIGQVPVVAVAYRGILRSGQTMREQTKLSRGLRERTRGLGPADILHLKELIIDEMAKTSNDLGWSFIDPMADMPADGAHFLNNNHLTSVGAAMAGAAVANAIAPLLIDQGHACMATPSP